MIKPVAAASAKPTADPAAALAADDNSELLQILNSGSAAAADPGAAAAKAGDLSSEALAKGDDNPDGVDLEDDPDSPEGKAAATAAAEAQAAAEAAAEAEDDDPDAALDAEDKLVRAKFTPEQQERFDKAVSKKTRRILELRTELRDEQVAREQAEHELESARANPPAAAIATADDPLADVETEPALDKRLAEARKLRRFALTNPDGTWIDKPTGQPVADPEDPENPPANLVRFTKQRLGQILAETEEILQDHGPRRREFLRARTTAEAAAIAEFPWLAKKNTQGAVAVEAMLRETPALRAVPGVKRLLAEAFLGRQLLLKEKQRQLAAGNGAGALSHQRAPASPAGGGRPARIAGGAKLASEASKHLADTGDDPDNAGLRAIINA